MLEESDQSLKEFHALTMSDDDDRLFTITAFYHIISFYFTGGVKLLDVPLQYTFDDISEILKAFGTVVSVKRQSRTDQPTGYVFVYFSEASSAKALLHYSALVWFSLLLKK